MWLTDDLANTITKCDTHGNRLMLLGPNGLVATGDAIAEHVGVVMAPCGKQSGEMFNRPTDVVIQ